MGDSFSSVTIDTITIVQVGESEYVNTLGNLSSSSEIPQLIKEGKTWNGMFSEGGFVLKLGNQFKITGGYYLKTIYKSYEDLPLTLSVPEVAAALGISRAGAYELVRSDSFPKIRIPNYSTVKFAKLFDAVVQ